MKALLIFLALLNGGYMLVDGLHVILKRKYIGPPEPGPWRYLFQSLGIDVFRLGPLFVVFGAAWLVWLYGLWIQSSWAYALGLVISISTLWYLPVGTLFSLIVLLVLLFARGKTGI